MSYQQGLTASETAPEAEAPVCVLGAGSSGIVAAKVLQEHGVPFEVFEMGSGIGGNWRFRNDNGQSAAYASLHINTSKEKMAFSDFPMPEEYPDYPHHSQVLEYFESYVDHFGIRPHVRFRTRVESVRPAEEGGYRVTVQPVGDDGGDAGEPETRRYRAVLVCNGHHWDPKLPDFPGEFSGRTIHSHDYETPKGFEDQDVLVVGIGNSGVDVACDLSRVASRTFLSTRRSAHVLPKYAWGRPIDHYTSPFSSKLPLWLQRIGFELILKLVRGPQERLGVPAPDHRLLEAHPTVSSELLHLVGHGEIEIKPNVAELRGERVRFVDGSEEAVDAIVYATGYKVSFPFFEPGMIDTQENEVRLYRQVVHPDLPGLYFIGLIQPLGAVMPLAEVQAEWVAKLLTGECALPDHDHMLREYQRDRDRMRRRYVTSTRHTLQVDFYPYRDQLRKEIRRGRRRAV